MSPCSEAVVVYVSRGALSCLRTSSEGKASLISRSSRCLIPWMGIGVPGGGVVGPDTRTQSLGAKPSAIGLDFAAFFLDPGEEVELLFAVGEVKHLTPSAA